MCDVYYNCEFCLAAPGSASHSSGLYSVNSVPTEGFTGSSFDLHNSNVPFWNIYGREPLYSSHRVLQDPDSITMHHRERNPFTLRFRGWVYQERMLAPRTIQFLDRELSWDCRMDTQCECGMMRHEVGVATMGHKKISFVSELQGASAEVYAARWRRIVSSYTSLYLTKEEDRLPAIAGVTRMFEQIRGVESRCHAGIWSDTAVHDLCWLVWDLDDQRKTWAEERSHARIRGAPTWSWASVNAYVGYFSTLGSYNHVFQPLCEVLDIEEPVVVQSLEEEDDDDDDNDNGIHDQAQILTIRGYLLPASLVYQEDIYLEDTKEAQECVSHTYALRFKGKNKTRRFDEDDILRLPGNRHVPNGASVFCLVLGRDQLDVSILEAFPALDRSPDQSDSYHSMVLTVVDASENKYRRIGLISSMKEWLPEFTQEQIVRVC